MIENVTKAEGSLMMDSNLGKLKIYHGNIVTEYNPQHVVEMNIED